MKRRPPSTRSGVPEGPLSDAEFMRWLENVEVEDDGTVVPRGPAERVEVHAVKDLAARPRIEIPTIRARVDDARATRIRVLQGIAGLLLVACAVVWGVHLGGDTDPLAVDHGVLPYTPMLHGATSVGPLMYVVVDRAEWTRLEEAERVRGLRTLAHGAADAGYEAVYFAGEDGAELAWWSPRDGLKRAASAAATP